MKHLTSIFTFAMALTTLARPATAAPPGEPLKPEPVATRLLFQDRTTKSIRWADLRAGKSPTIDAVQDVAGFPTLDDRQGLVQMRVAGDYLLVGIRDDDEGSFGSGWVLVATGVEEEPHGDHSHWHYPSVPAVRQTKIDTEQGNPAHLYVYDDVFYLANDRRDGYTRLDPKAVPGEGDVPTGFHQGGGGHITLAVAGKVGYSAWIDREGVCAGRVDVTAIRPEGNREIAASFALPTGGIHGATAVGDKVFFAPSDGICWVRANGRAEASEVRHIALGDDPATEKPRRTGAFAVHRDQVLFVTGSGEDATLGLLDARADDPELTTLMLAGSPGTKPVTPVCLRTSRGKHYAFVFHDAKESADEEGESDRPEETLNVVDLDPNSDGNYADAKIARSLPVGASAVVGHGGHHSIAFDPAGRRAFIANPGAGTVTVIALSKLEPVGELKVGGQPESIIAVGGRETSH